MEQQSEAQKNAFAPVQKFETNVPKNTIGVSPKAVAGVRAALLKRGTPEAALRVGIKGGGCSGFSYVIEFSDDPPRKGDTVLEYDVDDAGALVEGADVAARGAAKVRVYCDKKSILYLGGSVLDYEKTLMYQGFKFKNPQEATKCGCGHSFTVT